MTEVYKTKHFNNFIYFLLDNDYRDSGNEVEEQSNTDNQDFIDDTQKD